MKFYDHLTFTTKLIVFAVLLCLFAASSLTWRLPDFWQALLTGLLVGSFIHIIRHLYLQRVARKQER
ncbi:hypothetical protein ACXYMU_17235 [Pontibacter sp. CAU 1760]